MLSEEEWKESEIRLAQ